MGELLNLAAESHADHLRSTSPGHRKKHGQVFTAPEIARFMAGLFRQIPPTMRVLDPGAGAGSLSSAVCERVLRGRSPRCIDLHLFETDHRLIAPLRKNLDHCRSRLEGAGHSLKYTVHEEDFIAATAFCVDGQRSFLVNTAPRDFDAVIMNPPYFKVRKDSEHAKLMRRVVHGQPNAYAFFLALAACLLKPGGELVAITPRSFCNGLYFRGFRRWFFERMALERVHLFESRTEAFKESEVLQESVITRFRKSSTPASVVTVTGSYGKDIDAAQAPMKLPLESIIDNSCGEYMVKIPVSQEDFEIMRFVEALPCRFEQTGLRISTGPVVTFRAVDLLLEEKNGLDVVPLLMPHNVKPFHIVWPVRRRSHACYILDCPASRKRRLLVPARNYVVLKRFSAKEEKRRLTAGCMLGTEFNGKRIGLENHLNYIYHADRELTEHEVFGIAALFNSVLIDRYFRLLSGNTQVNATEIRNLHFPRLAVAAAIGAEVVTCGTTDARKIEEIVLKNLGAKNAMSDQAAGSAR